MPSSRLAMLTLKVRGAKPMASDPRDISVIKAVGEPYRCAHYRDFVRDCIEDPSGSGSKHGSVQKVARSRYRRAR